MSKEIDRLLKEHKLWAKLGKPPVQFWADIKVYLADHRWNDNTKMLHRERKLKHMGFDVKQLKL